MGKLLKTYCSYWWVILACFSQENIYAYNTYYPTSFLSLTCTKANDATNKTTTDGEAVIRLSQIIGTADFSLRNSSAMEILSFSLDGPTINTSLDNLAANNYTLQVTDASSTSTCSFTIGVLNCDLTVQAPNTTVTCAGDLSDLASSVSGGIPPYQYQWNTGSTATQLLGVPPGTYSLTVTDHVGCERRTTGNIVAPSDLQVATVLTNATDIMTNNGEVQLTAIGGTPAYHLEVMNTSNSVMFAGNIPTGNITIPDLPVGLYSTKLTDANNCVFTGDFRIGVANCSLNAILDDVTITCDTEVTDLAVQVSGNLNPVTYNWQHGPTISTLTDVGIGTYTVSITDATGNACQVVKTVKIAATSSAITSAVTVTSKATNSSTKDGELRLTITGGNMPYSLNIMDHTGGAIVNNLPIGAITNLDNFSPGAFTYTVTDNSNCIVSGDFLVGVENCTLQTTVNNSTSTCDGTNATLTASTAQSIGTVSYLWNTNETTPTINGLVPGTYSVTATDGLGCQATTFSVLPNVLQASTLPTNATDVITTNGQVVITGMGGTPTYYLEVTDPANSTIFSENIPTGTVTIPNLMVGLYSFKLTDANNCVFTGDFRIGFTNCSLTAILNDVTLNCATAVTNLAVQVAGTLNPVTYNWQHGPSTSTLTNVGIGTYTVTITDATGTACQVVKTAEVISSIITSAATIANKATDFSTKDGEVRLNITGSNVPYTLNIMDHTGVAVVSNRPVEAITNLDNFSPGAFTYTVTDNSNCRTSGNFLVGVQNCLLQATVNDVTSACDGSNATLTTTTAQSVAPISYLWSTNETTQTITGLASGTYAVTATDGVGCQSITSGAVTTLSNPTLTASVIQQATGELAIGKIRFAFQGNAPPFTLTITGQEINQTLRFDQSTSTTIDLPSGIYQATLTQSTGCQASTNFAIQTIIPTFSQWGILLFGLLILNLSILFLRRMTLLPITD